jgi:hypothetical protein
MTGSGAKPTGPKATKARSDDAAVDPVPGDESEEDDAKVHPIPGGIKRWAVTQMYKFCVEYGLQQVWVYLRENMGALGPLRTRRDPGTEDYDDSGKPVSAAHRFECIYSPIC